MTVWILVIVSGATAFGLIWLVHYVPIYKKVFGVSFSPRLLICKLLVPFDIWITIFLMIGGILGLSQAIGGIQSLVYGTFTAVGVSIGVYIMHKIIIPRWKVEYLKQKERI
jgi:hypothetical protein